MARRRGAHQSSPVNKSKQHNTKKSSSSSSSSLSAETANRPRNHLITDATKTFTFEFQRFGSRTSITVGQTPEEDTWPGGALWDLGVLLSQVLVLRTRGASLKSNVGEGFTPPRIAQSIPDFNWKEMSVLELGCGVGLTGLVASALGARATVLTDLDIVIDQVTRPNLELNAGLGPNKSCGYRVMRSGGRVAALPLCWGNQVQEQATLLALQRMLPAAQKNCTRAVKGRNRASCDPSPGESGRPDLIIIGDVAYQHKPGAPSHFEALRSTLANLMDEHTLVLFGTRMRMPASADLLALFHEDMEELLVPPLQADELDASFRTDQLGRKHNMTIHFLSRKK